MGRVFDTLEEVDIAGDAFTKPLPLGPEGLVKTGVLDNGVTYYVRSGVTRPRGFAALSLVIRAGSLCETDEERGVAHLVEHLAFNATERFDHHEVVKFLESIGSEFGPCLNAFTSPDETIYHLRVPHHSSGGGGGGGGVDDPALVILDQGISILSEWAYRIRFLPEDIAKEKDVILEELRASETSAGLAVRGSDSNWIRIRDQVLYGRNSTTMV
nr:zinc protease PQQl-like isoform X4 (FTSH4) [Polytomella parva]